MTSFIPLRVEDEYLNTATNSADYTSTSTNGNNETNTNNNKRNLTNTKHYNEDYGTENNSSNDINNDNNNSGINHDVTVTATLDYSNIELQRAGHRCDWNYIYDEIV